MHYPNGSGFLQYYNVRTCALSWIQVKIHNLTNKPKSAYLMINITSPRCHSTIKRVWGCTNCQDGNRFHIYGDTTPAMSSLSNPSSSLKVKAKQITHNALYGGDIYSKCFNKCDFNKCDDQQDCSQSKMSYSN